MVRYLENPQGLEERLHSHETGFQRQLHDDREGQPVGETPMRRVLHRGPEVRERTLARGVFRGFGFPRHKIIIDIINLTI